MDVNERSLSALYARWLDVATKAAFALALAAFVVYVTRLLPAYLPLEELPRHWRMPVGAFLAATGTRGGIDWLGLATHGDSSSLAAVALVMVVTPLCYARLLPVLVAERDWLQAALVLAQLAVLAAAASGLLAGGG